MANGIVLNIDTTKSEFQNPMVQLRQGDGNYQSLDVTVTSNGEPLDLTGWTTTFMGTTAGGFKIVDSAVTVTNALQGEFTYTPTKAWGQDQGELKNAYFKFTKAEETASGASFRVNVLDAVDLTAEEAGDYISVVDVLINDIKTSMDTKLAETKKTLADTQSQSNTVQTNVNELNKNVNDLKSQNNAIKTTDNTWTGTNTFNKKIISPAGVQGNADSATKLQTPRKINGTNFDGTADINVTASNDENLVHKKGTETVVGDKTFSGTTTFTKKIIGETAGTQYYDEITYEKHLDSTTNTYYSIITVPYLDKKGKRIKIKNGFSGDQFGSDPETILDFKKRHENASLIINAMPWVVETGKIQGRVIADGVALQTSPIAWGNETLGLLPSGELKTYTNSVGISDILAEGVTDGWAGFFSLIVDHQKVDYLSHQTTYPNVNAINSHQVIAQMDNLDLKIFTFGGNTKNRPGFTLDDCYRVLSTYDPKFAYNLDGGGSTSTVLNGSYVSDLKDDFGRSMRKVPSFIYFEKDDEDLKNVNIVSDDQSLEATKNGNAAYRKVFDDILSPTQDVLNMQLDIKQIPFSDISTILNSLSTYRGTWKNAGGDVAGVPAETYNAHYCVFEIIDFSDSSGIIRCSRYGENKTWQAGVNAGVISAWKEL